MNNLFAQLHTNIFKELIDNQNQIQNYTLINQIKQTTFYKREIINYPNAQFMLISYYITLILFYFI